MVGHIAVAEVVAAVVGYGEEGQRKLVRRLKCDILPEIPNVYVYSDSRIHRQITILKTIHQVHST